MTPMRRDDEDDAEKFQSKHVFSSDDGSSI